MPGADASTTANPALRRTKIVATLGPASESPEMIRRLIQAGMDVARLNFSHGTHEQHARNIASLREIAESLDKPITILQDLQGPKIRVGTLPEGGIPLEPQSSVVLVPVASFTGQPGTIPIDYPHLAADAREGMRVLLADGIIEFEVTRTVADQVHCRVVQGGLLASRKSVNLPSVPLRLPSLTEKDRRDLDFGLAHGVDIVSLSFVRCAADVHALIQLIGQKGARVPVIAKIEKPQAIEQLDEIIDAAYGVMVARGDLGVEMSPEQVPMIQKRIIELCNRRGRPVITATQMLESMMGEPRPTRAEASDVANAIIDGTDAVMLSGETAIGQYPVESVDMMLRIAREVEQRIEFRTYPASQQTRVDALSEGIGPIESVLRPACIAVLTTTGHTAARIAVERPRSPVMALTTDRRVYHALNLIWGIRPLLIPHGQGSFEELVALAEQTLRQRNTVKQGDAILVIGGIPAGQPHGSNFIKIHMVGN